MYCDSTVFQTINKICIWNLIFELNYAKSDNVAKEGIYAGIYYKKAIYPIRNAAFELK